MTPLFALIICFATFKLYLICLIAMIFKYVKNNMDPIFELEVSNLRHQGNQLDHSFGKVLNQFSREKPSDE